MSIKTLELNNERLKLEMELSKQRHEQRIKELLIRKEIEQLKKEVNHGKRK